MNLSIVIPAFNNAEHVHITLTALKRQTVKFDDWEVLLIDDSYDETMLMFEKWDFPALRVIEKKHSGRADTRNVGIKESRGDIIVFLDSDIIVDKNFVQSHYDMHMKNECDIVLGKVKHIPPEYLNEVRKIVLDDICIKEIDKYVINESYLDLSSVVFGNNYISKHIGWICCLFSNCSVKKKVIETSGLFDTDFVGWGLEDIELGYRFHINNYRFGYYNEISGYHIDHVTDNNKMLVDMGNNLKKLYKKYSNNDIRSYMSFVAGFKSLASLAKSIIGEDIEFTEGEDIYFKPIQYTKSKSV